MTKLINTIPAKTITDGFTTAINAALVPLIPFKINLTDKQKTGARSMAEGREGYVRLISRIANQFPNSLSRVDVPSELVSYINYYDNLEGCRLALLQALETITEVQLGGSIDIMAIEDRYTDSLQSSRKNEASLDLAMREVDEWNKRFAPKKETEPETDLDTTKPTT